MSDEKTTPAMTVYLSDAQRARVDALRAARVVIGSRGPMTSGAVEPTDLVAVAHYIITGEDPWPPAVLKEATNA